MRRIGLIVWVLCFLLLLVIHWYPIRFGAIRFVLVADVLALWAGALWLIWNRQIVRNIFIALSVLPVIFVFLPARSEDSEALRQEYVASLQNYEGVPYVWGGETKRGIDCSGLMRCALIDANLKRGFTTFNPSLLRSGFSIWWNDCSAKAMKEEFQGKTRLLFTTPTLNQVDYSAIEPGDIAVTSSGAHVLAYIGQQTWIEADPSAMVGDKVIKVKTPTRNAWFNTPVHIMRWRQFEDRDN